MEALHGGNHSKPTLHMFQVGKRPTSDVAGGSITAWSCCVDAFCHRGINELKLYEEMFKENVRAEKDEMNLRGGHEPKHAEEESYASES